MPPRQPTHLGDRNEDRSHVQPTPRNVGLTEPPTRSPGPPVPSAPPIVPRREFDFDQKTPPAMDPSTYHALQTMRAEVLNVVTPILDLVDKREKREAELEKLRADERERRRKYIVPIITALGIAITGIVAAFVHGCS